MGLEVATIAAISAGVTAATAVYGISQNNKARKDQEKAKAVADANNYQQQMDAKRQQIREERVRRARVLQSAEGSGAANSSSEAGALGSLSTQLSSNMGSINAGVANAQQISIFQQNAADSSKNAQISSAIGGMVPSATIIAGNIFSGTAADTTQANTYAGENRQRLQR